MKQCINVGCFPFKILALNPSIARILRQSLRGYVEAQAGAMNELQAKYAAQTDTVVDLQSQVSALEERLAQLEASLKK